MLKICVSENGVALVERQVASKLGETGCVVLLQETYVATLTLGDSCESGPFQVAFIETEDDDEGEELDSGFLSKESSVTSATNVEANETVALTSANASFTGGFHTPNYDEERFSIEIFPRIPDYEFQALIACGGMGFVWKAMQLSTNRPVAVKTIHPKMLGKPKNQLRFRREVELAANLNHPNIVRVYEAGSVAGQNYFSMELVDGMPWSQYVRSHRPGKAEVLKQLLDVLDAVSYAHAEGIIHRDLKPSNVLIDKSGKVFVVDFGLAKHRAEEEELSKQGDIIGTLSFMSPEQASGDVSSTDSRSDVYSLGVVLVYLLDQGLSSKPVWMANKKLLGSGDGLLQKYAAEAFKSDRRLQNILLKALAVQPEYRYQDAGAFANDLREYLEDQLTKEFRGQGGRGVGRQNRLTSMAVLALAVIFGGLLWAVLSTRKTNKAPEVERPADAEDGKPIVREPPQTKEERRVAELYEKFGDSFEPDFIYDGGEPDEGKLTYKAGADGLDDEYVVHPDGWPLVGFHFTTYGFNQSTIIKTIQPIFRDPNTGEVEQGQSFGRLHRMCKEQVFIAEPGYVVLINRSCCKQSHPRASSPIH